MEKFVLLKGASEVCGCCKDGRVLDVCRLKSGGSVHRDTQ